MIMNVLIACEESQRVCMAFRERGHNAFSCDVQECSGGRPEWHIQGDARLYLSRIFDNIRFRTMDGKLHSIFNWDLLIAHPPCTFLSNAGACRLYPHKGQLDMERYAQGLIAKDLFLAFYLADIPKICIENPIPSKVFDMPEYTQIIQPYEYGEPYSKKTCLWLNGLPKLEPTDILRDYKPYVSCGTSANKGNPEKAGVSRAGGAQKVRSKTFWGIARAMAAQWG